MDLWAVPTPGLESEDPTIHPNMANLEILARLARLEAMVERLIVAAGLPVEVEEPAPEPQPRKAG